MSRYLPRLVLALLAPLLLVGCILTPGKFVSNLRIDADRTFTFSYKGEVIAIDPSAELGKDLKDIPSKSGEEPAAKPSAYLRQIASNPPIKSAPAAEEEEDGEAKNRAMAEALSKELGYRSVTYQGKGKFLIDYEISGKLTHGFVFPYNSDAEAVFPFLMIELRANNTIRVRAPGFANDSKSDKSGMGGMSSGNSAAKHLDGVFTLDTDAEIVSQNNEDGPAKTGNRSTIRWRATPLTKDAPIAVLRMKG